MATSSHNRAVQDRHAALLARQRAQRASLDKVAAALARVQAAEERALAELEVGKAARKLAEAKSALDTLVRRQRRQPSGRALKSVPLEQAGAGREIRAAVDAFGSVDTAARTLGLPVRTVRKYLDIAAAAEDEGDASPTA